MLFCLQSTILVNWWSLTKTWRCSDPQWLATKCWSICFLFVSSMMFTWLPTLCFATQARGKKRKIGWFPANYVKILGGSARNTPDAQALSAPSPQKSLSPTPQGSDTGSRSTTPVSYPQPTSAPAGQSMHCTATLTPLSWLWYLLKSELLERFGDKRLKKWSIIQAHVVIVCYLAGILGNAEKPSKMCAWDYKNLFWTTKVFLSLTWDKRGYCQFSLLITSSYLCSSGTSGGSVQLHCPACGWTQLHQGKCH